jgi:hypothetical protein
MTEADLFTRFIFNNHVIVDISSDYVDSVMVEVSGITDPENSSRSFQLEPDEIDLFIQTLTLFKNRIKQGDRKVK